MQPVIDNLQEIINDIDTYDMPAMDRFVASILLCNLVYIMQTREDALNAQRNQAKEV